MLIIVKKTKTQKYQIKYLTIQSQEQRQTKK